MPIASEPKPVTPEASGAKLPNSLLNPIKVESAYQDMRGVLKTASTKKTIASTDEIKTTLEDGTALKMEDAERNDLLKTLNEDQGDTTVASEKIELCETTYKDTGEKFKTEEEGKKSGGLIAGDNGFEGKFYRKNLQKLSDKDPDFIAEDVSPEYAKGIRGLRRQVAEGDTQAQKTYETLRDGNAVRVTYTSSESGSPQTVTVTLKEFDDLLEKEAANLWTQTHGGEMSFADAKTKFPQIAHAYRIKAERKIASDAKYNFHSTEEQKPDSSDPNKPEAERNKEDNTLVITLMHDTLEGFAELNDSKPNEEVATLTLITSTLQGIPENTVDSAQLRQRDNLTTLAYVALKNIKLDSITDPGLRTRLETLQKGIANFEGDDGRVIKLQEEIKTHWLTPNGLKGIPLERLTRDMILAMRLEATEGIKIISKPNGQFERFEVGDDVEKLLAGWGVQDDERQQIFQLATGDNSAGRLMSREFGIDNHIITDAKSGETVAQNTVNALVATAENRGKKEKYDTREKIDAFLKFFRNNLSEEALMEFAKKHGFPPGMGMGVLIIAMFLPMIQGTLEEGGKSGGGQGEG